MTFNSDLDALTHEHVYLGDAHDENARRTLLVVGITAVMMVGEIVAGTIFNSMALLADGFHMATHAGALAVAAGAYAFAKKHARTGRYTFGTGKVGDLAGFASALVLGVVALGIAWESVIRLLEPKSVAFGEATIVAVIGLGVNLVSALLLSGGHHPHGHDHHDHHHDHDHGDGARGHGQDNNLRAAFIHVLADALTSVLAIAALLAGRFLGWTWLDAAMGIVGAAVIARTTWNLINHTGTLMHDRNDDHLEAEVREEVEGPGGAQITDLHVWRVGPGAHAAIVSYVGDVSAEEVRRRLKPVHELTHVTVETLSRATAVAA
jgi:cation diffusion facilitator family transporter